MIADLHIHTVASQHAYSTIDDCANSAAKKGLKVIGITDHGPGMLDGPREYFFMNLRIIPNEIQGVRILKAVELNIMDDEGKFDLRSHVLRDLDYAIASFHNGISPYYYNKKQYTNGFLTAMENPKVKILGHPDNPRVPIDFKLVLEKAYEKNILLEVNNASYGVIRPGSYKVGLEMLKLAKEIGNYVVLGSDAHYKNDVGNFKLSNKLIQEAGFPIERVVNSDLNILKKFINV